MYVNKWRNCDNYFILWNKDYIQNVILMWSLDPPNFGNEFNSYAWIMPGGHTKNDYFFNDTIITIDVPKISGL